MPCFFSFSFSIFISYKTSTYFIFSCLSSLCPPSGQMAFPFTSSPFSYFLPSTLFTSSHNPFLLFLYLFLLFFLPYYSCKVTINASQPFLTFVHKNDLNSSHGNWIEIWFFKDRESDICGNFVNPKIKIGSHDSSRISDKNCAV